MRVDEPKTELLDPDDAKVAHLLAGLKRVDAPTNFEFRLKARLANATPPARGFVPAFVKYAAPVALVAAVSSVLFVNSSKSPETTASTAGMLPQINVSQPANSAAEVALPPPAAVEAVTERPVLAANPKRLTPLARPQVGTDVRTPKEQNRSKDIALKGSRMILPRGFNSNTQTIELPPTSDIKPLRPAIDVFPILGIDAGYDEGWKVRAIRKNSPADRAGVKAGDVLEAIDDNQLGKDAMFKSGFNGKVIKVKRDGKSVDLSLENK